jgi:hypothetical protein
LTLDRPNVIIFFTDWQRWDTVSLHGNALGHKLDEASRWRRKLQITTSAGSKKCSADIGLTKVAKREKIAHHLVCKTPASTRSDLAGAL